MHATPASCAHSYPEQGVPQASRRAPRARRWHRSGACRRSGRESAREWERALFRCVKDEPTERRDRVCYMDGLCDARMRRYMAGQPLRAPAGHLRAHHLADMAKRVAAREGGAGGASDRDGANDIAVHVQRARPAVGCAEVGASLRMRTHVPDSPSSARSAPPRRRPRQLMKPPSLRIWPLSLMTWLGEGTGPSFCTCARWCARVGTGCARQRALAHAPRVVGGQPRPARYSSAGRPLRCSPAGRPAHAHSHERGRHAPCPWCEPLCFFSAHAPGSWAVFDLVNYPSV